MSAFSNAVTAIQKNKKVVITIHDAARLRSTQMFGKQDPYTIAYVETNKRKRVKTHVDDDGGLNPSWERKLSTLDYKHEDKSDIVCFEIWNQNSLSDTLIGQASCKLSELYNPAERSVNLPVSYQGTRQGSAILRVSAHFTDTKTVARHGAAILQSAVSSPAPAISAPNTTVMPTATTTLTSSVPTENGSAQWVVGKDEGTPVTITSSDAANRFKTAARKVTGPTVSIGMGGANVSSLNATSGTGLGFRGGYKRGGVNTGVGTASNVAFAANRFRSNIRTGQPQASVVTPFSPTAPTASIYQQPTIAVQPVASPRYTPQQPYPTTTIYGQQQPPIASVQPYPSASSVQPGFPIAPPVSPYPTQPVQHVATNMYGGGGVRGVVQPVQATIYGGITQPVAVPVQPVQPVQPRYGGSTMFPNSPHQTDPNIQQMRAIIGNGPTDVHLNQLLAACGGDPTKAIQMFYQNGGR